MVEEAMNQLTGGGGTSDSTDSSQTSGTGPDLSSGSVETTTYDAQGNKTGSAEPTFEPDQGIAGDIQEQITGS